MPTLAMALPLALSLLIWGVAPSAAPGGMRLLSLSAELAGLCVAASVGWFCLRTTSSRACP